MSPCSRHDPSRDYIHYPTFSKLNLPQRQLSEKPVITAIVAGEQYTAALYSDGLVRVCGVSADIFWLEPNWDGIRAIFPGKDCLYAINQEGAPLELSFFRVDGNMPLLSLYRYRRIHPIGFSSAIELHARPYRASVFSEYSRVQSIAAGRFGLLEDGTVFTRDPSDNGLVRYWSGITSITAGTQHYFGLTRYGTVLCAGDRRYKVMKEAHLWNNITAIAAGAEHLVGLRKDGTVMAAGRSGEKQCSVEGWYDITAIAAGGNHTIGLRKNGSVTAVGDNTHGQCSIGSWSSMVAIATSSSHTVGLRADGSLAAVGDNRHGQCDVSYLIR